MIMSGRPTWGSDFYVKEGKYPTCERADEALVPKERKIRLNRSQTVILNLVQNL
jgi:hypothetical protein